MGFPMMCGVLFAVLFSLWLLFDHHRTSRCRRSEQKQYRLTAQKSLERLIRLMEEEDVTTVRTATVRNGEARSDYALPHLEDRCSLRESRETERFEKLRT